MGALARASTAKALREGSSAVAAAAEAVEIAARRVVSWGLRLSGHVAAAEEKAEAVHVSTGNNVDLRRPGKVSASLDCSGRGTWPMVLHPEPMVRSEFYNGIFSTARRRDDAFGRRRRCPRMVKVRAW